MGSEAVARAIGFFYTALVGRLLGVEGFGLLSLSLVYSEIFALAIGMSFHEVFVREVLQRKRDPGRLLGRMVRAQWVLAAVCLALAVGIGMLYEGSSRWLLPIAAGMGFARALARTYFAVSVAQEDFRPRSVYGALDRLLALAAGLLLWSFSFGVVGLLAALFAGTIVTTLYAWGTVRSQLGSLRKLTTETGGESRRPEAFGAETPGAEAFGAETEGSNLPWRPLLREGLSFSAVRWIGVVHNRVDQLILQSFIGPAALGIYSAAYRLMEVFKIVPNVAEQTLFPGYSKLAPDGRGRVQAVGRAVHTLLAVVVPLVVAAWTLDRAAVVLVFGSEFAEAARPWTILMLVMVMFALSRPFLVLLRASGDLRTANVFSAIAVVVNIVANLFWIPKYGPTGAALATLISEGTFVLLCLATRAEFLPEIGRRLVRLVPATAACIALAFALRGVNVWLAAVTAGLVYLAILWATGFSAAERRDLQAALRGGA